MKIFIPVKDITEDTVYNGDVIKVVLFNQELEVPVTRADFQGIEVEINAAYQHPTDPRVPYQVEIAVDYTYNKVCPDCKGTGVIQLFNSIEKCGCQNG